MTDVTGASGDASATAIAHMDIHRITELLPHRYPFLMVDRVVECLPPDTLVGIKNVSFNEPYFQGHFPRRPVMPGVLILEALAQATGLLAFQTDKVDRNAGTIYYFVGIDKARFKRVVEPGDQLRLHVRLLKAKRGIWVFDTEATVDGQIACNAELMCTARSVSFALR